MGLKSDPVPRGSLKGAANQKLPTLLFFAYVHQLFELQAVGAGHAHRGDLKRVNRISDLFDLARHRFAVAVGEERRDPAFVQQQDRFDVQPGAPLSAVAAVPRP